ncbi:hypothetical protein D3C72_1673530 [compost metagenome]
MGVLEDVEELDVVRRAGAAAVALQQQTLHAAVEYRAQLGCGEAGEQWLHGEADRLTRFAVVQLGRGGRCALAMSRALGFDEGVEGIAALLAGSGTIE